MMQSRRRRSKKKGRSNGEVSDNSSAIELGIDLDSLPQNSLFETSKLGKKKSAKMKSARPSEFHWPNPE